MKRAAIVTVATLLAGCAVGPDYSRPSLPMPGEFASTDVAAASKVALPEQWWTLYGDATLDKLVAEALARNADLQVAVARVAEAEANLREAGAYLYPEFDAGLNGSRSRVSASTALPNPSPLVRNDVRLALGTAFELDFWGRLRRGQEAAGALAISSRYGRDVVRISIAGLVTQAYFTVRSLDAQLRLAASTYDARKDSLDVAGSRVKAGLASDLDVNQARIAFADASLQIKELTRQRELTEHQLATIVGRLDLKIAPEAIALPGLPAIPSAGLPSELLERRPDVRQAEQLLVAANAQIGFAKAAYFPTITLAASYGGESATLASTIKSAASIWSVGAGAVMPLLDWGKTTARVDAATARTDAALAIYRKSSETAFREVSDALTEVRLYNSVQQELEERSKIAQDTLDLVNVRYRSGYSAYLEVLDAQRTANDALLAVERNKLALLAASVNLMKALGGGWPVA